MPTRIQIEESNRRRELRIARCSQCQTDKSWDDFEKCASRRPFGLSSLCITCNKKRKAEAHRQNRKNNPEQAKVHDREIGLRRKFGINTEDYDKILDEQDHKCAICKLEERYIHHRTGKPARLAVDHCHETNKIRGLLCSNCNRGLGFFNDDIDRLQAAINYLKKSER